MLDRICEKMWQDGRRLSDYSVPLNNEGWLSPPNPLHTIKILHINLNTLNLKCVGLKSEPCGNDPKETSFISYTIYFPFKFTFH